MNCFPLCVCTRVCAITLEKKLNGPNIGCLCQVCMGCILMIWVNFNNVLWPMILEQSFVSVIMGKLIGGILVSWFVKLDLLHWRHLMLFLTCWID